MHIDRSCSALSPTDQHETTTARIGKNNIYQLKLSALVHVAVWNSFSDICNQTELVSSFRSKLKTELLHVGLSTHIITATKRL